MDEETKKIMAIVDKYEDFFKENHADIALGRKGVNFFYLYDDKYKHMDILNTFITAEQLETIIIGALTQNLEVMNYAATEDLLSGYDEIDGAMRLNEFDPGYCVEKLTKQLEVMLKEQERWSEMMSVTYKSLRNITKDM